MTIDQWVCFSAAAALLAVALCTALLHLQRSRGQKTR
jgi:hypothetical protein